MTATRLKKNGNGGNQQLAKPEPSIAIMLQQVIHGGITPDTVGTLEKMLSLYERMQDRDAEKQFAEAYNRLMKKVINIQATKPVKNKDGTERYRYAPLDEIDAQLRPVALKEGFTYSFAEGPSSPDRITKICTVQHTAGHKRTNSFTVRVSGPPGASITQADASTHSYAKRGALIDAFGIIVDHDDDARMEGKPIGRALAEDLMDRVRKLKCDEQSFLKFAGVAAKDPADIEDYMLIGDERYVYLNELLEKKERGTKKPNGEPEAKNDKGEFVWGGGAK